MSLFALLEKRQAINRPVRIGVIGAGTFSSAFLNQVRQVPGMKVVCIADDFA
jgi:predicted homoserine dehydrogenase-like protein